MIHAQNSKIDVVIFPQVIADNAEWVGSSGSTANSADALGFHYGCFNFMLGASDIAVAGLIVVSSTTSTLTSVTARYTFGGTGLMALPGATSDDGVWRLFIDLRKYGDRYWGVTATAGNGSAGSYAAAWYEFFRADEVPNTAAERGCTAVDFI